MCLYTKQICPLRARRDIVCYKKFHVWNTFLQTYYKFHRVVKPKKDHPTLMDDANAPLSFEMFHYLPRGIRCQIFGGMIHAYKTKPMFVDEYLPGFPKVGLYKCIIPKGTLYYAGVNGDICAKKMLVIEEVNPNTAG